MGIEDRLREDLRRSGRTATSADALPRTVASSTASPTGNEASSFRSRPSRSRWPPPGHGPVARHRGSLALGTSISRIRPCSPSGQGRPSTVEC